MKRITIKWKIFIYICSLTVVSLIIISSVTYTIFFNTLKKYQTESTVETSNKTKQNMEFILEQVDDTGKLLGTNSDLIALV